MKPRRCPRLWQVEALRDGRISGTEAESAQSHVARCPDCSRELEALKTVGRRLRANVSTPDEMSIRRLRYAVLARADAELRRDGRARPRTRVTVFAAAFAAAIVMGFGVRSLRHQAPAIALASDLISISPSGARWTRSSSPGLETIELVDGALSIATHHVPHGTKVVVRVPDGEVEDLGTVFKVSVRDRRTQEISVAEGVVTFRRPGASEVRIEAGTHWIPTPEMEEPGVPTSPATPLAGGSNIAVASAAPVARTVKALRPHAMRAARPSEEAHALASRGAEQAGAPLGEDDIYLRIIALLREDRPEEARVAALDYLRRFPNGFRREEVERIAQRR